VFIDSDFINVVILLSTLVGIAGVLENIGYWSKSGYYLYNKEDSFGSEKKPSAV
jgi:membrane-associated protein